MIPATIALLFPLNAFLTGARATAGNVDARIAWSFVAPARGANGGALVLLQASAEVLSSPLDSGGPTQEPHKVGPSLLQKQAEAPALEEYICGGIQDDNCPDCPSNADCQCDGLVKLGHGESWTDFIESDGSVQCSVRTFQLDPLPGHGKKCLCQPTHYECASETHSCSCDGEVRYGHGSKWTQWMRVEGSVECKSDMFSGALRAEEGVCQCKPHTSTPFGATVTKPLISGLGSADRITWSLVSVIVNYFVVYALLAIMRTCNQMMNFAPGPFERTLESTGAMCVCYAPMLCICFFAVTEQLETLIAVEADSEVIHLYWIGRAVELAAAAFFFQTSFHFISDWVIFRGMTRQRPGPNSRNFYVAPSTLRISRFLRVVSYAAMALMYVALGAILSCTLATQEIARLSGAPGMEIPAATVVTLSLVLLYFMVYLTLQLFKLLDSGIIAIPPPEPSFRVEILKICATTVNFAPMMCAVFMGSQIAADWNGVALPRYVDLSMFLSAGAMLVQVVLVMVAPSITRANMRARDRSEVDFVTRDQEVFVVVSLVRWVAMTAMYIGIAMVCVSVWNLQLTARMTRMLYRLAMVYFSTYLLLWCDITAKQLLGSDILRGTKLLVERGVFCPMLAALFLEAWVRARRTVTLTGQQGVPQGYVQDLTYVATAALLVQLVMVMLSSAVRGPGGASPSKDDKTLKSIIWFCYHAAMVVLYASVFTVMYGLFTVGPTNATREGAWIL